MDEFFRDQLIFLGFYTIAITFFNLLKTLYRLIQKHPQLQYNDYDSDQSEPESEPDEDYVQPSNYPFKLRKRKRNSI